MFDIDIRLKEIKKKCEYRELKFLESAQDVKVKFENRTLHIMGSNNYLSLNKHPLLNKISKDVTDAYGTGSGGSRLTTGSSTWHKTLEDDISRFKKTESSLVFANAYMANLGLISALCNKSWTVFSDKYNHASIIDGITLSGAKLSRYKHCDIDDLETRLSSSTSKYKLIITDSVFSMDGNIAPIKRIASLAKEYNALFVVDDAHGFGVLGKNGRGISEHLNLTDEIDLTIGSLSKAIPSSGGYVTGKKTYIDFIKNKARSFIFSTSLPANAMAVSSKSIEIIESNPNRRSTLYYKTNYFIEELNKYGFDISKQVTPIVSIIIGDSKKTIEMQEKLFKKNIFIPGIRPPTVPKDTSRLRASINYNHTLEDLAFIAHEIYVSAKELDII